MSKYYINFTPEQKERASHTDLVELLQRNGEKLKRSGSEYEWKDGGQKVTIRGFKWFHQYDREGGDAIEFCRRFYGMNYPEAVKYLLESSGMDITVSTPPANKGHEAPSQEETEEKTFSLPPRNADMKRVYGYLLGSRGIDPDILKDFVRNKMIYEDAEHHNVVFVGYDTQGNPRHASKRSTLTEISYKGNEAGSEPEYSFHRIGTSNRLYLFEAPIDMLSFISMHKKDWQQHSYAAACSVSDKVLFQTLQDNPKINEVYLCLDNDEAGQAAEERMSEKLVSQGICVKALIPAFKDWNEDLTSRQLGNISYEELCGRGKTIFTKPLDNDKAQAMMILLDNEGIRYRARISSRTIICVNDFDREKVVKFSQQCSHGAQEQAQTEAQGKGFVQSM